MGHLKGEGNKKDDGIEKGANQFAKYTGLAFQMGAIIFITVWGGQKLDEKLGNGTQLFTIIFSLLGVFAAIYVAIKDFIKIKDK